MSDDEYRDILSDVYGKPDDEPTLNAPTEAKAIIVDYHHGERVRLVGSDELGTWGWITAITARPSGIVYEVSWPTTRTTTNHYAFELAEAVE